MKDAESRAARPIPRAGAPAPAARRLPARTGLRALVRGATRSRRPRDDDEASPHPLPDRATTVGAFGCDSDRSRAARAAYSTRPALTIEPAAAPMPRLPVSRRPPAPPPTERRGGRRRYHPSSPAVRERNACPAPRVPARRASPRRAGTLHHGEVYASGARSRPDAPKRAGILVHWIARQFRRPRRGRRQQACPAYTAR